MLAMIGMASASCFLSLGLPGKMKFYMFFMNPYKEGTSAILYVRSFCLYFLQLEASVSRQLGYKLVPLLGKFLLRCVLLRRQSWRAHPRTPTGASTSQERYKQSGSGDQLALHHQHQRKFWELESPAPVSSYLIPSRSGSEIYHPHIYTFIVTRIAFQLLMIVVCHRENQC